MLKRKNKNAAPPRPRLLATAALALALGVGGLAAVQPALADEGSNTTDVTIQVSNEDGNIAWSAPTVVPMKATAAGTLIGPNADVLSIRNLSAFPIRVKTMDAQAVDPFHLVANADSSTGNNDFQMSVNGVAAAPAVELADDGTWAMGYAGNNDGTDVLPLTISGAKIARVTEDLSAAKKAATVTWTVEPTVKEVKQDPQPDPENGVAFAVYSADDKSLDLYKRDRKPEVGDTFNGKAVTKLFDVNETKGVTGHSSPFKDVSSSTKTIEVVDSGIKPMSTSYWFSSLSHADTANVVKLDTSVDQYMSYMFAESGFTSLDLSVLDTSANFLMQGMFQNCSNLTTVGDISRWNTSNANDMSNMFDGCSSLTNLDLSRWNVSGVTIMDNMFTNCSSLTTVGDLSRWNLRLLGSATNMFSGCSSLTSLNLSGWDLSSCGYLSNMFSGCSSLTSLDLSGWTIVSPDEPYAITDRMFDGCSELTTVNGLSDLVTSGITSMSKMFNECPKLTANCSNWDVSNVFTYDDFNTNAPGVIAPNWIN